jgi:hypothetical protein
MEPISVRPYPRERVFRWPELRAAVSHAFSHPLLPAARQDVTRLGNARLSDAHWTLREWSLSFDNDLELRVWPEEPEVRWHLGRRAEQPRPADVLQVGSPPILIRWLQWQEVSEMDWSALVAKRLGASFRDLFVNDGGLFVYFEKHLVLCFHAICCDADEQSMLYVYEDD